MKKILSGLLLMSLTTPFVSQASLPSMVLDCKPIPGGPILKINVYMHVGRMGKTSIGSPTVYAIVLQQKNSSKKKLYQLMEESHEAFIVNLVSVERDDIKVRMDSYEMKARVRIGNNIKTTCNDVEVGEKI